MSEYVLLIKIVTLSALIMFVLFWLIPNVLSWTFRYKENKLLRKIKREIKEGAMVKYYEYGLPCHTRCDFVLSFGSFSTTLDPTVYPFGVIKVIDWYVFNSEGINKEWVGKSVHCWAQNRTNLNG